MRKWQCFDGTHLTNSVCHTQDPYGIIKIERICRPSHSRTFNV